MALKYVFICMLVAFISLCFRRNEQFILLRSDTSSIGSGISASQPQSSIICNSPFILPSLPTSMKETQPLDECTENPAVVTQPNPAYKKVKSPSDTKPHVYETIPDTVSPLTK